MIVILAAQLNDSYRVVVFQVGQFVCLFVWFPPELSDQMIRQSTEFL